MIGPIQIFHIKLNFGTRIVYFRNKDQRWAYTNSDMFENHWNISSSDFGFSAWIRFLFLFYSPNECMLLLNCFQIQHVTYIACTWNGLNLCYIISMLFSSLDSKHLHQFRNLHQASQKLSLILAWFSNLKFYRKFRTTFGKYCLPYN